MRLRREVGDFNFEIKNGVGTIPKNLFPEQLIGQIVIIGNVHAIIMVVIGANGDNSYGLGTSNGINLEYTVATGAVTVANPG